MQDRTISSGQPSRLGLFGMVAAAALERVADAAAARPACSPAAAMGVYAQLAVLASQQGTASSSAGQCCTVTVGELAARCRMGRRTVQTYLALLTDAGVLTAEHRFDRRGLPLASTLVFQYPRRDAPLAAPQAADKPDSAITESPDVAGVPRESHAAGGAHILERVEQRDSSLTLVRGADDARAYLAVKCGWSKEARNTVTTRPV